MDQQELQKVLRKHSLWTRGKSSGEKAELRGVDLSGANLKEAKLSGADLRTVELRDANLERADLRGADLRGADLTEADMDNANLEGANLRYANLTEANLRGADLREANLRDANLRGADLSEANLIDAYLREANLREANLSEAYLYGTNLLEANLENANLEGANLEGANLEGAVLKGTLLESVEAKPKTAYGQKRSGVKALKKVVEPIKVAAFKKLFPEAFEAVKHDIGGGTLTPEAATALINRYGMTWQISTTKWESKLQRVSPKPNDVLQLNIDLKAVTDEEKLLKNIEAIRQVSFRSQHPVLRIGPLTIGWVRYSVLDLLLVEEVQSDLPIVRKGMSDAEFQRQLVEKGLSESDIKQALDVLQPFVDRFYFDALALVLDIAAEAGLPVEMLSYEQKRQFKSPRSLYEELPKRMGMRKAASKLDFIEGGKTWQISPNPVRRGRVRIPKTWSRK